MENLCISVTPLFVFFYLFALASSAVACVRYWLTRADMERSLRRLYPEEDWSRKPHSRKATLFWSIFLAVANIVILASFFVKGIYTYGVLVGILLNSLATCSFYFSREEVSERLSEMCFIKHSSQQ